MDKNKILDSAAKLVAKGAYDKAIKEYQKVLDADPKDGRVLHKLGELYEKKNDNRQAASFFTRVADGYANDGFSMKAIALYKKVLKLDPNLIEVNVKLAELHQQHQLMSEAMGYYQAVANHYDKKGDVRASLDILKKMVDLDPDNVASRIKLADLYARENLTQEATGEYRRAAEHLRRNNRVEDYLRVAERLAGMEPSNTDLARELAQEYLNRNDQKRALAKLQVCFKADPRDVQTLNLLAQAFQGLGQTSKTLSVYKELAKIHQESGRTDEASRVWAKVAQIDPQDPDLQARAASLRPAAAPQPAAAPASAPQPQTHAQAQAPARPAAPAPAPPAAAGGMSRDQLAKLLTETDVYVKYGLHDKALEHLRRVFSVDPENLDAHEKAYHIYVSANNAQAASEQLLNVLRLCTRKQEVARSQPYLAAILQQNPNHPEVPAFLAVLRTSDMPVPQTTAEETLPEDAILVDSSDEEIIVADAPEDALAGEDLALAHAQADVMAEEVIEDAALADEPLAADAEDEPLLYDEPASAEIVVDDPALEVAADEPSTQESWVDASGGVGLGDFDEHEAPTRAHPLSPELVAQAKAAQAGAYAQPEPEPELAEAADQPWSDDVQVEEPELVSTGGYQALGDEEPPTGSFQFQPQEAEGAQPAYEQDAYEQSAGMDPDATGAWAVESEPAQEHLTPAESYAEEVPVEAPPEEEPATEECDEAAFFLDQGLHEEAREILETVLIAFPGHVRAGELLARLEAQEAGGGEAPAEAASDLDAAPPQVDPVPAEEEPRDAFDLAAELAGELDELGGEAEAQAPSGDDYQVSVEEVFSEFKKGLEKIVKPEDVETHYDLGIAYKEMGLIDDAIGEFEVARQGCVGKRKEVDCLTMVGLLQMMKGDAHAAIDAFKQALQSPQTTRDSARALRFELATAWEAAGNPGKALFHLNAVAAEDPNFRGVGQAQARLSAVAEPEADEDFGEAGGGGGGGASRTGGLGAPAAAAPAARAAGSKSSKVGYI